MKKNKGGKRKRNWGDELGRRDDKKTNKKEIEKGKEERRERVKAQYRKEK